MKSLEEFPPIQLITIPKLKSFLSERALGMMNVKEPQNGDTEVLSVTTESNDEDFAKATKELADKINKAVETNNFICINAYGCCPTANNREYLMASLVCK